MVDREAVPCHVEVDVNEYLFFITVCHLLFETNVQCLYYWSPEIPSPQARYSCNNRNLLLCHLMFSRAWCVTAVQGLL